MKSKIKAMGLAAMALLAMGAVMATGAQAATFTASSYPASGTGEQKTANVITVQEQKVECTGAHFEGGLSTASSHEITITPKYTGCKAFGFANAKVVTTGCDYKFTIDNGGTEPNSVHIICEGTSKITVTAPEVSPACTVKIGSQTPTVNKFEYANNEGGVHMHSTLEGMHMDVTKNTFLCPLTTNHSDTSGKYTGSILFKGIGGKTFDIG